MQAGTLGMSAIISKEASFHGMRRGRAEVIPFPSNRLAYRGSDEIRGHPCRLHPFCLANSPSLMARALDSNSVFYKLCHLCDVP